MRNLILLICVMASIPCFAAWHVIKGNGVSRSETREAAGYTSLASGGQMNIEITYGTSTTIKVEGEENLLSYIETEVKDNRLTIKVKSGYVLKTHQPLKVYVSMTTIGDIAQSGSGSISGDGNFTNDDNTIVAMSGSGSINLHFASLQSLTVRMSGSGSVKLAGSIKEETEIKQSGSGNMSLEDVVCNNVTVKLSGSGNLRIHTDKALTAQISGSGSVYYSGDATVASKVSGSGRIQKI